MAAAVAKPGQALRRSRPSLNSKPSTRAALPEANGIGSDATPKRLSEPYVKDTNYILRKFKGRLPSLVVHLHPTHFRFEGREGSFGYDSPMKTFLYHLRRQTVPHELLEELLADQIQFYDGCLIVQVHDEKSTVAKAQDGNIPSTTTDKNKAFSMHNYHEHITPSPYGPYPRKPSNQRSPSSSQVKADGAAQAVDKKDESVVKQVRRGPRVTTLVLHPTALSRQHEMLILANTPFSESRAGKKGMADQPPPTPLSAVPPTPSTANARGQLPKKPRMCLEEKDYYNFEAELLLATEPPLLLAPARNPEEANMALQALSHPLHSDAPPSPKTRKRTHAEMAADDAQAAEEERRLLIMDERVKPSMRTGAGMATAEGQASSSALGFSRFKTLETIKQRHEENERRKKEEEARQALEKRTHDAALAKRKILEDRQRQEHAAIQKQQMMLKQQQAMQQQQQQQAHSHNMAHPGNALAANPQQQHLQQASLAQQSSPIVRQQTPMMASSPMQNPSSMAMGGFPMQPTASNQGAGSPARPPSAMQHSNVAMARQISQQQQQNQSRHATPQMAQNTPRMAAVDPNRQISATPHMQHRSPVVPMGTPNQLMMNNTPQMNQQHLTPGQQMALLQKRQQQAQMQAAMQGSPQAGMTTEQVAMMRAQQQMALQAQQQNNPQAFAQHMQRMQQMGNMQGGNPMQQNLQGHAQQMGQADPQMLAQRQQQMRAQQMMQNQRMMQQMQANGQPIPQARIQQMQQMQQMQMQQQQRQAAAMRANQAQSLGDPANTDQYMANLRNQQALLARMQNRNQAMNQQQNMMQAGGGGQQNMQQMNMLQQQQMQQQQQQLRNQQSGQDLAQQFAAMQNALNMNRPGSGMG